MCYGSEAKEGQIYLFLCVQVVGEGVSRLPQGSRGSFSDTDVTLGDSFYCLNEQLCLVRHEKTLKRANMSRRQTQNRAFFWFLCVSEKTNSAAVVVNLG